MAKTYLVQHRRGTAQEWADKNTIIPGEGEIVIEIDYVNSLHKLKIGDGIHTYAELNYLQAGNDIVTQVLSKALPRIVTITLDVNKWVESKENSSYYSQAIALDKITRYSRLDLQPDENMLIAFKELGISFITKNHHGTLWVHSVGAKPTATYTMQATIVETEVEVELDAIVGSPVGVTNPHKQPDWNQDDPTQLDFIYNKPTLGALASKDKISETELAENILLILEKANSAPVVYEWAMAETKPTYTASEIGAVAYTAQDLTEEQKAQARANIGAGSNSFSGDYNDLINKPTIPSIDESSILEYVDRKLLLKVDRIEGKNLSTNDFTDEHKTRVNTSLQYIPQELTETQKIQARLNLGVGDGSFSGNYNDLVNKPEIPTKLSQLENDRGFITSDNTDGLQGTIDEAISLHDISALAHEDIRELIADLVSHFNALLGSDDIDFKQLRELLDYIESNQDIIAGITTNKVNVSDIVDNLTTNASDKPLSAAQGVIIKSLLDNKVDSSLVEGIIKDAIEQAKANGELSGTSVSITDIIHSDQDGGENTVVFSDGNSLTVRNGSKGSTPIKGVDYFTETDKTEMVNLVISALPNAENISV